MDTTKPNYFKYAFLSSLSGKFGEALSVSINTLLVAFGASAFQIGLINALKSIGQTFSQFIGLWYLNKFKSRKTSEIVAMIIIGLPVLVLAIVALTQSKYWFALIACAVFFSGLMGKASYLCWYTWMSNIVPNSLRNYFFGTRSFFGQVGGIVGFIIAFFVLQFNIPILVLLSILYFASYLFRNIETANYFFHPDAQREMLRKNHIVRRMKQTVTNPTFVKFLIWFILLNSVLITNILYLEFFMIHELTLTYTWIPMSFIIIALSSAASFYRLRNYFPKISYTTKRSVVSSLVIISSAAWIFTNTVPMLIISLVLAGFSTGALSLCEKVDLIALAEAKDEEAHFAVFSFLHPLFASIFIILLNMSQLSALNMSVIFSITIFLAAISLLFVNYENLAEK